MGSSIRSWHQFLFYVDWTKGHWLLNKKHLHHPSAHFPSGRPKGCVITVPVEEFLQHPDSAAGAQTAHDDERKQQALPTTWGPGVQQLKFLLLFITLWHTHTYMCTHTHTRMRACMHTTQDSLLPLPPSGAFHWTERGMCRWTPIPDLVPNHSLRFTVQTRHYKTRILYILL